MVVNANQKRRKYLELVKHLKEKNKQVKFVNLPISALGLFDQTSPDFTDMMKGLIWTLHKRVL